MLVAPATGANVPPQVSVAFGGVFTTRPLGNVSVKPTPVNATVAFGLVIVKLIVTNPIWGALSLSNDFMIVGGATTVMLAEAVPPAPVFVPPLAELTLPVVLFFGPAVVPVTVTMKMQLPPAAIVPPVSVIVAGAVVVTVPPPQPLTEPFTTVNPAGSVSVTVTPVSPTVEFGLVIVKLSMLVPFSGIVAASNDFMIVGGATTVIGAVLLVPPGPDSLELTLPVVFDFTPAVAPVTVTLNVHIPPLAMDPPLKLIRFPPLVVTVPPPHAADEPLATVNPAGNVSVKLTPVMPKDALVFVIVKVRLVVPPTGIVDAPNDFMIVGAEATVTDALAPVAPVPPLVELAGVVWLFLTPPVVPVTVTLKVQVPLAAIVAPLSTIRLLPVTVRVPPH
jgi:hypothetical protein